MRNILRIPRLMILVGLAVAACRSSTEPPSRPSSASATAPGARGTDAPPPAQTAALLCRPPLRSCITCTGAQICAIQCPDCAPPVAGQAEGLPETLALGPAVASCGGTICAPGTSCCNPSCGICTPKGVNCTQQSCN